MNYKNIIKGFIELALVFIGVSLICIEGENGFNHITPVNVIGIILVIIGIVVIKLDDDNDVNNHIDSHPSVG